MVTPREARVAGAAPEGFTLVELVVAVVILSFGLLGMAGTTAYVVRTTTMAEAATDRTVALQSVIERVRATPFDAVGSGSLTEAPFTASWSVVSSGVNDKMVQIITTGPGMKSSGGAIPMISNSVADTFQYRVVRGR